MSDFSDYHEFSEWEIAGIDGPPQVALLAFASLPQARSLRIR